MFRAASNPQSAAFCGIHVISPRIFSLMEEDGVFPIVPVYLRLAGQGERIFGFSADEYYWRDLGSNHGYGEAVDLFGMDAAAAATTIGKVIVRAVTEAQAAVVS